MASSAKRNALRTGRDLWVAFIVLALWAATASAQPNWYDLKTDRGFKTDLPDFYQHQYIGDKKAGKFIWETNGGWCRPTALVDCLYYWKVNGYNGVLGDDITKANKWRQAACDEISSLQNAQPSGYKDLLNKRGHGEKAGAGAGKGLTFTQYNVNQQNGKVSYVSSDKKVKAVNGTAFDLYKKELLDGQDVMIRWAGTKNNLDKSLWWRGPNPDKGNYHYVTGAGVDGAKNQIFFADPDSNKGSAKANAGWNGTQKDEKVNGRKYVAADAAVPIPDRGDKITDDPKNFNQNYGTVTVGGDGFTLVNSERYTGVTMYQIETICPVKAAIKPKIGGQGVGFTLTDFDLLAGVGGTIDSILLFPTADVALDALSFTQLTDFTGDAWQATYLSPSALDPFGNDRSFGGVHFNLLTGTGLLPGEFAAATLGTLSAFEDFDILTHVQGAPLDAWQIQAIGAPEAVYGDQSVTAAAPEPASLLLMFAPGLCVLIIWRRRSVLPSQ